MAIDKAIDSAQLEAALKATADAIREKTGNTDSCSWDASTGFADLIAAIESGGGIPSNITELAGGTYTAASDIGQTLYIQHGMGKIPSMAVLWSESTNGGSIGWYLMFGGGGGYYGAAKGTNLAYADLGSATRRGDVINDFNLKASLSNSGTSAKAGDTFYWLAWV